MLHSSHKQQGYVVSDLHIFGSSSLYQRHLETMYEAFAAYPIVILNGDTFDFKRSIYHSSDETSARAIEWMRSTCERFSNTTFHFIIGNHDCNAKLRERLNQLVVSQSNLFVTEDTLRLGPSLFIHGDVIDLPETSTNLNDVRQGYLDSIPSTSSKLFATVVTHLRLNLVEYIRHSRSELAQRLLDYLEAKHPDILNSARTIYFGHTHVPFQNFEYRGFVFNNTGSLIRGLRWLPMECEVG